MKYVSVAGHKLFRVGYEDQKVKHDVTMLMVASNENDVLEFINSFGPEIRVNSLELIEDDISMRIPKDYIGYPVGEK